jgi:hypothetical protein
MSWLVTSLSSHREIAIYSCMIYIRSVGYDFLCQYGWVSWKKLTIPEYSRWKLHQLKFTVIADAFTKYYQFHQAPSLFQVHSAAARYVDTQQDNWPLHLQSFLETKTL